MVNNVTLTPRFEHRYKRFSKKFTSLEKEVDDLIANLIETPMLSESPGLGLYTIRLAVRSKGRGKSGGFRIVSYLITETGSSTDIFLLTIYDKSEDSSVDKTTLLDMVNELSD